MCYDLSVMSGAQAEAVWQIADSTHVCTSKHGCLRGINGNQAIHIVSRLVHELRSIANKPDRIRYICEGILRSLRGHTEKGYGVMSWTIGVPPYLLSSCCRWCFIHFFGIGNTTLIQLTKMVKQNKQMLPSFTDQNRPYIYHEMFKNALNDMAHRIGIALNHRQIAAMQIPNSSKVL